MSTKGVLRQQENFSPVSLINLSRKLAFAIAQKPYEIRNTQKRPFLVICFNSYNSFS